MSSVKDSVQSQFGKTAENYRKSLVHARGTDLEKIAEIASAVAPRLALDAGCGAGHTAATIAPHAGRVIALDFTESMLEQVKILANERGLTNLETRRGDVEDMPFADALFDLVASRFSAHHWTKPQTAIHECYRILKKGGTFLLSDVVGFDVPVQDSYLQAIEILRDTSHVRDQSITQWEAMLAAAGFKDISVTPWMLVIDFEAWVERMATPPDQVAMIRKLFDAAPQEVRDILKVQPNHDFEFSCAVIQAVK